MDNLLLLYPNRKSYPNQVGKLKDLLELFSAELSVAYEKIATLTQAQFGQKSEKTKKAEIEKASKPKKPCNRNKENYKHKGRNPFPEDLSRERIEYDLNPEEKCCPHCQAFLTKIGEEVTQQLDLIPQQIIVREHARLKYACRKCGKFIKRASMTGQPIEKGTAGAALLAYTIVSKYQDGLPLYRLERQFKRYGLIISRATLSGWMGQAAKTLEPIYDKMVEDLIVGQIVHSDETPMPMLDPGAGKTKQGYMWTHARKQIGDQGAITVYQFTLGRHGKNPQEFLKNLEGVVHADRYQGYGKLFTPDKEGKIRCRLAACWAHVRRYFWDALVIDSQSIGREVFDMINGLYSVEHHADKEKMTFEERRLYRSEKSEPILQKIYDWLKEYKTKVPPRTALGKAIRYTLNAWEPLQTFLDDGRIEIDNNRAERAIRVIVIGRNNFLFVGSPRGGKTAAILFSLVETCKQNDIDSLAYLTDVLKKIPDASFSHKRINELLPHKWKPPHKSLGAVA
jgi:transposase